MKRERFAWVTIVPAAWLVVCTLTAGLEKVASPDVKVGFVSHALRFGEAAAAGKVLAPAKTVGEMGRIVFNDYVDAALAALFSAIVIVMLVYGVIETRKGLRNAKASTVEIGGAAVAAE
jgi:carbon starvation protein CstA